MNPLLTIDHLPAFSAIKPEHIIPAIDELLSAGRNCLDTLLAEVSEPGWDNFISPLDEQEDQLNRAWSPVGHLHGVMNSESLRKVYQEALVKLTQYRTEMGQHTGLYGVYKNLRASPSYEQLTQAQRKAIDNALRDFSLAGVALPEDKKQRYREISEQLSKLGTQFSNNVLDATQGWNKHVTKAQDLSGLPETAVAGAEQAAKSKNLEGYLVTLDMPSYIAVMQYADDRNLREEVYRAYVTRASGESPMAGQWDNTAVMEETLALRHEQAQLLGFNNYAEKSLATKMAETSEEVVGFLEELAQKSRPYGQQDLEELKNFASSCGLDDLQAWDMPYYSEKLREKKYSVSQEELKVYFPVDKVIAGLFDIAGRLFGIEVSEVGEFDAWHDDVRFYQVKAGGETIASFYLDLFARANKRGGAWMDSCRERRLTPDGQVQQPVAYLVCNFTPPVGDKPSLLTHSEVTTLFHEFGHGLHHMLTEIDCAAVSGINGVAWDAVELPSQFLENWCWEAEAIPLISGHYLSGDPLPESMLEKMLAAKNFQSGLLMLRQLEFALFDIRLHREYNPGCSTSPQDLLDSVREQVSVVIPPEYNQFQHSFLHIFAGGYAAGYYSYKWAEVLSADAFSKFEEQGIFNTQTGMEFLRKILSQGGSRDAMELFKDFRGRAPSTEALLKHSGM